MESTSTALITLSIRETLTLLGIIIGYTIMVAKGYFYLVGKIKANETNLITLKLETTTKMDKLDELCKANMAFRTELLSEVSKGYENQIKETQKVMKEWMDMNKEEHQFINQALKENIKALTSLNTKFESHLSFEKGKSIAHKN